MSVCLANKDFHDTLNISMEPDEEVRVSNPCSTMASLSFSKKKKKSKKTVINKPSIEVKSSYVNHCDQHDTVVCYNTIVGLINDLHLDPSDPDHVILERLMKGKYKDIRPFGMTTRGNPVRVKF